MYRTLLVEIVEIWRSLNEYEGEVMVVELGKKQAWINEKLKIITFYKIDGWMLYSEKSELRFWNKIYQMIRDEGFKIK